MKRHIPISERWLRFQPDWVLIIIGVNVALYLLSLLVTRLLGPAEASALTPSSEALFLLGTSAPAQILDGQVHRLLIATWLHANFIHILFNMMALRDLGPAARHFLGAHSFLSLYGFSAVLASLVSALRYALPVMISNSDWSVDLLLYSLPGGVGASGALCGVLGFLYFVTRKSPGSAALARQLGFWLLSTLVIGFMVPIIDNAAHIGGLVAGVIFAKIWLGNSRPGARGFLIGPGASLFFALLFLLAFAGAAWTIVGPPGQSFRAYLQVRPAVLNAIDDDLNVRDLKDTIQELDELAIPEEVIDVDAIKGYLNIRVEFEGRRPSTYEMPLPSQTTYLRWKHFTRSYLRALGPLARIGFHRRHD